MISAFGIISIAIALASVTIIVLHNRLMLRRTPVDSYMAALEELLRESLERLFNASPPGSDLQNLCGNCMDLGLNDIIQALPDISRACTPGLCDEQEKLHAIRETAEALNQAIRDYNSLITGSLPMKLMAQALSLTTEEAINMEILPQAAPPETESTST